MGAGEALRRVLECLGSGILLAGKVSEISHPQLTPTAVRFVLNSF